MKTWGKERRVLNAVGEPVCSVSISGRIAPTADQFGFSDSKVKKQRAAFLTSVMSEKQRCFSPAATGALALQWH